MMSNRKVCQFYLERRCKYGDKCKNYHPQDINFIPNPNPTPINPFNQAEVFMQNYQYPSDLNYCRGFLMGNCRFETCRYYHGFSDSLNTLQTDKIHDAEIKELVALDDWNYVLKAMDCEILEGKLNERLKTAAEERALNETKKKAPKKKDQGPTPEEIEFEEKMKEKEQMEKDNQELADLKTGDDQFYFLSELNYKYAWVDWTKEDQSGVKRIIAKTICILLEQNVP